MNLLHYPSAMIFGEPKREMAAALPRRHETAFYEGAKKARRMGRYISPANVRSGEREREIEGGRESDGIEREEETTFGNRRSSPFPARARRGSGFARGCATTIRVGFGFGPEFQFAVRHSHLAAALPPSLPPFCQFQQTESRMSRMTRKLCNP